MAYGTPEYEAVLERAGPALEHHYRRNSHHPEHYGPAGVAGMDLFDLVEMVCDWMAAAERNPDDGVKLEYNVRLFGIEPQLASVLGNTLARWPRTAELRRLHPRTGAYAKHQEAGVRFETILYEEDGPVGWLTLNRPEDGNMFTATMCHEIRDCINAIRRETSTRVLVITGAGEKFFCLGGRKEGMEETRLYAGVLPTLEMYESIDKLQKP